MADLTADASIRILGEAVTERFTLDTAADRTVYKGQPMIVDQSVDATGNIVQFVDSVPVATTDVFVGIAAEGKTVASGAAETTETELYVGPTIVGFKSAVFTNGADLGKLVTMSRVPGPADCGLCEHRRGEYRWCCVHRDRAYGPDVLLRRETVDS